MITDQPSKLAQPRVFYTGLALTAALLVTDFVLLVQANGTPRQIQIYVALFGLATAMVLYRYFSSNRGLKKLGARGIWFLVAILVLSAIALVAQNPLNPRDPAPAAAEADKPAG